MGEGYHVLGGAIENRVKAIGEKVEPWLWIISLIGFGLSVWSVWRSREHEHHWRPW